MKAARNSAEFATADFVAKLVVVLESVTHLGLRFVNGVGFVKECVFQLQMAFL